MSKRFFNRSASVIEQPVSNIVNSNEETQDTQSVHSETSFSSEISWMNSDRNIFLSGIRRLSMGIDR